MARIIFDTETRKFSIQPSTEAEKLESISEELCHNLVRLIQRPHHESQIHWREEIYGFIVKYLSKVSTVNRKPIEFMFRFIGSYCNNHNLFFIVKEELENLNDDVLNEPYGQSRGYDISTVAYGIWIFYSLLLPAKRYYNRNEVKTAINSWYEIISEGYWEWESISNISRKSVRLFPYTKKFRFRLNY